MGLAFTFFDAVPQPCLGLFQISKNKSEVPTLSTTNNDWEQAPAGV